jgi:hypothetical protein
VGGTGKISGGFEDVISPEFLRLKWRLADWPAGTFSTVRCRPLPPLPVSRTRKHECTDASVLAGLHSCLGCAIAEGL